MLICAQYEQSSAHAPLAHLSQSACDIALFTVDDMSLWQEGVSMLVAWRSAIETVLKGLAITMPLGAAISIKWSMPAISSHVMDFFSFWRNIVRFD